MSGERLTRSQVLRRGAAGGVGLLLAAGGARAAVRLTGRDGSAVDRLRTLVTPQAGSVQRFVSRADLRPPVVSVVTPAATVAPGLLFLAPSSGPGQRGVMIVDDTGRLVWFRPTKGTAMNVRAATYEGKPVLTWWEGKTEHGLGAGRHVIVDRSYGELASFPAGNGYSADLHELILTPRGTALVSAWGLRTMDLTRLGGRGKHPVIEGIVQELAIPSARVLFQWRSLDHVPISESYQKVGPRFDYFHINSIDIAPDGDLIVSARNTWTVYKVSRRTGKVVWRLGGKRSDFAMSRGARFAWQHDARAHEDGRVISVFDNGAAPKVEPQSRAIVLALDETRRRATLLRRYVHRPKPLSAHFMGSAQILGDGGMLVGWGSEPYLTEFARDGTIRLDLKLPPGGQSYRALRFPWTGRPSSPPSLAARGRVLYASWNGATELVSWRLRAGPGPSSLADVGVAPVDAFETALVAPGGAAYAQVVALDRKGRVIGASAAHRL